MNKRRAAIWTLLLSGVVVTPRLPAFSEDKKDDPAVPTREDPIVAIAINGMVWIDVKEAEIGTPAPELLKLAGQRKEVMSRFIFEMPKHTVPMRPYFMDQFEVTNAQYGVFLDQTAKTIYKTGSSSLATLVDIAGDFLHHSDPAAGKADPDSWQQLYELNKQALEAALPALKGKKAEFKFAVLPPDIELVVYKRTIPPHWKLGVPPEGQEDHPVRNVSYLDAEAFAEWAGKHIPTEEEWEYAARGPERREYPWGKDWKEGVDRNGKRIIENRCNWLGLGIVDADHQPTTVAVDALPEGASWCGCYHMLGNVAEWTSTWFNAYPGGSIPSDNQFAQLTGDYVKVIRGASLGDEERLVLRLPARNFEGSGHSGRPVPENRFQYVGFRCASYSSPAMNRLAPVIARTAHRKKVKPEDLAQDRAMGAATEHFSQPPTERPKNDVRVISGSAAILFIPKNTLYGDEERAIAHAPADILNKTGDEDPLIIGVIHSDLPFEKMKVIKAAAKPGIKPPGGSARRKGAKGAPAQAQELVDGKAEAGSYVLGLWQARIGLFQSNLDFVAFFEKPPHMDQTNLKKDDAPPDSKIEVDTDADMVTCTFWIGTGGKETPATEGITISWFFLAATGQLDKAGTWISRPNTPAPPAPGKAEKKTEKQPEKPPPPASPPPPAPTPPAAAPPGKPPK